MKHASPTQYRADIDGLRAVAVLIVVGFHAFPTYVRGGFIGVDIFFVISGYLITQHILFQLQLDQFSFLDFYFRRIRRIFPALVLVLTAVLAFGWMFLIADEYKRLGLDVAAGSAFVSNLVAWAGSGYFNSAALETPLLHLWSLGIEEQFYIFWPLLLWLTKSRGSLTFWTIAGSVLVSFTANIAIHVSDPIANYYSPLSRMWELGSGGLIAWLQLQYERNLVKVKPGSAINRAGQTLIDLIGKGKGKLLRDYLSLAGLVLITVGLVVIDRTNSFPGWWAVLPVLGTICLIGSGSDALVSRSLLSQKLLVRLGLISYPLYLWHWPLLSLAYVTDVNHYDRPLRVFLVGLSVLLAWCTHRFLELPIRGRAVGVKQAIVLSSLLALLGGLGFITYSNEGFITRVIAQRYVGVTDAFNDWAYPKGLTAALEDRYTNYLSSQEPPVIAFIGDSHIEQFGPRVVSLTQKDRFSPSVFITEGGCPPIPNVFEASHPACNDYISRIKSTLSKYPSIKTLVIGGCWNCYFELEAYSEPDSNKFNYYYSQTDEKIYFRKAAGVQRSIDSLAQFLKTLSLDYRVYLLLDNPLDKNNNPRSLINNRFTMSESSAARRLVVLSNTQLALNNRLKTIATAAGAEYIDQLSSLCPSNKCSTTTSDGVPIYKDDHHLRPFFVIEHAHYLDFLNLKVTGQR